MKDILQATVVGVIFALALFFAATYGEQARQDRVRSQTTTTMVELIPPLTCERILGDVVCNEGN